MKTDPSQDHHFRPGPTFLRGSGALILAAACLPLQLSAFSGTPPTNRTGAPGSVGTCAACHTSVGSGSLDLGFLNTTLTYQPGETYMIDVAISDSGQKRFGYSMVARTVSNPTVDTGSWAASGESQVYGGNAYVGHSGAPFVDDANTFQVSWTAPAEDVGPVTFFAAAVAANGNRGNGGGDNTYLQTITIEPASVASTWGGYTLVDDRWIDTGEWLGWLALFDPSGGPTWVYSLTTNSYFYFSRELQMSDPGVWVYSTRE